MNELGQGIESPRLQDADFRADVDKAQAEIEGAIKSCDESRFNAAIKALDDLALALQDQIKRRSAPGYSLLGEGQDKRLGPLEHDQPILQAMIANARSRFALCRVEQPKLPPNETFSNPPPPPPGREGPVE